MKKIISLLTAMLLLVTLLAACTDGGTDESGSAAPNGDSSAAGAEESTVTEKTSIRIGGLKGPTSIGKMCIRDRHLTYFFDGDTLFAIRATVRMDSVTMNVLFRVTAFTDEIPEDMPFAVPQGYTEYVEEP